MDSIKATAILKSKITATAILTKSITAIAILTTAVSPFDTDALTFLTAAGITDSTQRSAINTLVTSMKTANIWEKMIAVYPIVGGTANTHSFNLINPNTFQITWVNTPTHSATGVDYNGVNEYGRTGVIIRGTRNAHIGAYIRQDIADTNDWDLGASDGASQNLTNLQSRNIADVCQGALNSNFSNLGAATDSLGMYIISRPRGNPLSSYKNGVLKGTISPTLGDVGIEIWVGGVNSQGTLFRPTKRQAAFYTFGDELDATEVLAYFNAIQTYQTSLSRNV